MHESTRATEQMSPQRCTTLLAAALVIPSVASAQRDTTESAERRFFTSRDALAGGAIVATSAVLSLFDERIARWTRTPAVQGGSARSDMMDRLTTVNEVPLTIGAAATWAIGRLAGQSTVADIGLHTSEALLLTLTTSEIVRGSLGRIRPRSAQDDPYDFQYGKGFTNFAARSYPSIHSGVAFAAATALTEEIRIRRPGAVKFAAPLLYGAALVPGITRMYLDQHWTSDIVAGAAVGTLLGNKAVSYAHSHRPSRIERALLGATVLPDGRGGMVAVLQLQP
jgi:membrane-associated phospholipid phosphatase